MFESKCGKKLYKFYREKETDFTTNYRMLLNNITDDWYHGYRVSIKKLNSVFKLLHAISDNFDAEKRINPFKSTFKTSGKIRESIINLNTFRDIADMNPKQKSVFVSHVNSRITKHTEKLNRELRNIDLGSQLKTRVLVKRNCTGLKKKTILSICYSTIEKKISDIRIGLKNSGNEEFIHHSRKLIKEISETLHVLRKINNKLVPEKLIGQIKKTEEKIGNWHDKVVLREDLERFLKANEPIENHQEVYENLVNVLFEDSKTFMGTYDKLINKTMERIEKSLPEVKG